MKIILTKLGLTLLLASLFTCLTAQNTSEDAHYWKHLGDVAYLKISIELDNQKEKRMTENMANQTTFYIHLEEMYNSYSNAFSRSNNKSSLNTLERKDIQKKMKSTYSYFINAGAYYNDKKNYSKSSSIFEIYWNLENSPLLPKRTILEKGSIYQATKYYSIVTAIKSKDSPNAILLLNRAINERYYPNDVYKESDLYELLSEEYKAIGDLENYQKTLKIGSNKFPNNKYFAHNIVNKLFGKEDYKEIVKELDRLKKKNPDNNCDYIAVKADILQKERQLANAEKLYLEALSNDANCQRALVGIAVGYILQAMDMKDEVQTLTDNRKIADYNRKTVSLYTKSLPYLEKHLLLIKDRDDKIATLHKLKNVYYNLLLLDIDKNRELETVEKELEELE